MKKAFLGMLLVGGGLGAYSWNAQQEQGNTYTTARVMRGELVTSVTATGTIEPEELVDVGAQVAGMVTEIGQDPNSPGQALIKHGTLVQPGTVLARLDDTLLKTKVSQASANLKRAEAEYQQAEARCRQAERELRRAQQLRGNRATAEQDYEKAFTELETANANLATAVSTIAQSKASLDEAIVNLGYTTIRSPVRGVVIDRRVNVGQTVVANLNTPSLFLIARDLARMQIWVSVNEADVNRIQSGQPARFTVSGLPGEKFDGRVAEVRLNASLVSNVVIYTVTVAVDNSSGRLLPYQTARVQFEVDRRQSVLLVPNAALRWTPRPDQVVPQARADLLAAQEQTTQRQGTLWLVEGNLVRPVRVRLGATDGTRTEIIGGELDENSAAVLRANERKGGSTGNGLLIPSFDEQTNES
jgi:HlyD family secretion protein